MTFAPVLAAPDAHFLPLEQGCQRETSALVSLHVRVGIKARPGD
jgi:hypothetical protein